jgi:hypothetical protein
MSQIDRLASFLQELQNTTPEIGWLGGRFFRYGDETHRMNDIVNRYKELVQDIKGGVFTEDLQESRYLLGKIYCQIIVHDSVANQLLDKSPLYIKILTYVRQFFGNLFSEREEILRQLMPKSFPMFGRIPPSLIKALVKDDAKQVHLAPPSASDYPNPFVVPLAPELLDMIVQQIGPQDRVGLFLSSKSAYTNETFRDIVIQEFKKKFAGQKCLTCNDKGDYETASICFVKNSDGTWTKGKMDGPDFHTMVYIDNINWHRHDEHVRPVSRPPQGTFNILCFRKGRIKVNEKAEAIPLTQFMDMGPHVWQKLMDAFKDIPEGGKITAVLFEKTILDNLFID